MKGDDLVVTIPEPEHLDAIIDHLRANARFESMLAQRLANPNTGDGYHPASEAFLELAEIFVVIADAVEGVTQKRLAERRAELEAQQ